MFCSELRLKVRWLSANNGLGNWVLVQVSFLYAALFDDARQHHSHTSTLLAALPPEGRQAR
jgi:hypothetical protein